VAGIRPGGASRRTQYGGKVWLSYTVHGRTYVRKWPRARGKPKLPWALANLKRMAVAQRAVRQWQPEATKHMQEGLDTFLREHVGLRGTAAIRLRDWLTQVMYGRAWDLVLPTGKKLYSYAAIRDASDFLDWLEPRYGSVLVRTPDGWHGTWNCKPGGVFTMAPDYATPLCCPPADVPPRDQAAGGY